jgi:hypothetical protein
MDSYSRISAHIDGYSRRAFLPVLAAQFVTPEKIRMCAIVGAMLVVLGAAMEIVSVWPSQDVDTEEMTPD